MIATATLRLDLEPSFQSALLPDCAGQEDRFARAYAILKEGVARRAFPGVSFAVAHGGRMVAMAGVGHFTYEPESPGVTPQTIYDLASLTKPIATTTTAMLLFERGLLDLEMPVGQLLPEFLADSDSRRQQVTLAMLLAHSAGLPAYERLFENARGREEILAAACAVPLAGQPGTRDEYSDIGFIILGEALRRVAGEDIDSFCRREVFAPLSMAHTAFNPPDSWHAHIPPTEDDLTFRHRIVHGEVNDENAWAMGGVSGHAGLFATAYDVALFAECMLNGGARILRPETVHRFTTLLAPPDGTGRTLGWDTPTAPSQSGKHLSSRAFGHLGFTGTSLWIDPERRLSITLLTNRTWPDRRSQLIKEIRPRFHDAIFEALFSA
jgi:CubicO group peptidase (beta-lactamase class C family)